MFGENRQRGFVNAAMFIVGRVSTRCVPPVIEQDVEVAGYLSERAEEESDLASMVNSMNGGVVHQFSKSDCVLRPVAEREIHDPAEVFIAQI
jgi:hypothetical protein